jgi:hypothetical protein
MDKEKMGHLIDIMRRWQKIENTAATQTARIMEESENPLVRLVAEIIQRDTQIHHRVQQMIIDSQKREKVTISHDDLEACWSLIADHIQLEKKTIELAGEGLAAIKGTGADAEQYLLTYLLRDEEKHEKLLADLELIKNRLYPKA